MSDQPLIQITFKSADFPLLAKYYVENELGLNVDSFELVCYGQMNERLEIGEQHIEEEAVVKVVREDDEK